MSKRARRHEIPVATRARPLSKELVVIAKDDVSTQVTTVLHTASFPCTVTGLRWDLNTIQDGGIAASAGFWVIAVVREGVTIDTIQVGDGNTFFEPEQNVMAFGINLVNQGASGHPDDHSSVGSTKTMRKLQTGDTLVFAFLGTTTNTQQIRGVIQFMCMT